MGMGKYLEWALVSGFAWLGNWPFIHRRPLFTNEDAKKTQVSLPYLLSAQLLPHHKLGITCLSRVCHEKELKSNKIGRYVYLI